MRRRGVRDYVSWVLYDAPVETIELWTTVNALLWGAWLLNPWMTMLSATNIYATMALVPEVLWGIVAVLAACVQFTGRITGRPALIRHGARALAALWMFGGAAIAVSDWRLASIITYPMMAAASLFVSYRASSYPERGGGAAHGRHS